VRFSILAKDFDNSNSGTERRKREREREREREGRKKRRPQAALDKKICVKDRYASSNL
jgi:hypothetical protein